MVQKTGSLNVVALRVSALTEAGAPQVGGVAVTTKNVVTIGTALEIADGEEIEVFNADGDLCVSRKDRDKIKRATLSMSMCELDFDLTALLCGGTLHTDGAETIGYSIPKQDDPEPLPVCFEAWTIAWDGDGQALDSSLNPRYHHWVFPFCRFRLDDTEFGSGAHEFAVEGTSIPNGLLTTSGPFNDWPSAIVGENVDAAVNDFLDINVPTIAGSDVVPVQS
ncbi:MAG: hypothetical protein AAGA99_26370 [Actinomycetota bacterium]